MPLVNLKSHNAQKLYRAILPKCIKPHNTQWVQSIGSNLFWLFKWHPCSSSCQGNKIKDLVHAKTFSTKYICITSKNISVRLILIQQEIFRDRTSLKSSSMTIGLVPEKFYKRTINIEDWLIRVRILCNIYPIRFWGCYFVGNPLALTYQLMFF